MKIFKSLSFFIVLFFSTVSLALPSDWPKDGLIIQPQMKRDPLLNAFKEAKKSIRIAAYSLTDEELIAELAKAVKRGVVVEILVTNSVYKREAHADHLSAGNIETPLEKLEKIGAIVKPSPDFYAQSHYKLIIIDGAYALIGTGNMNKDAFDGNLVYKGVRDFWFTVTKEKYPQELKELQTVFQDDFKGKKTNLKDALLVWSPDQGREPFLKLIQSAKKNIFVYQQSLEDKEIVEALVHAARKGIDVRIMMTPFPFTKAEDENLPSQEKIRQAGGKIGLLTHLYVHAKVVVVDVGTPAARALVGSTNFYTPSLDKNRELGIITSDPAVVNKLTSTFEEDWPRADFTSRAIPLKKE